MAFFPERPCMHSGWIRSVLDSRWQKRERRKRYGMPMLMTEEKCKEVLFLFFLLLMTHTWGVLAA